MRGWLLLGWLLAGPIGAWAQGEVAGYVRAADSTAVTDAYVVLYDGEGRKLLGYAISDTTGFYLLRAPLRAGIYLLEATRLGFAKHQQPLVISTDLPARLPLDIWMARAATSQLNEVIIRRQPPVVVKSDTILYDVAHFTEAYDQTLEEVLAKIQGFRILPNGDIEVNGRPIRKVLVDGKEVSDVGAALLTRSISPQDVEKVEVRLDEKNKKLRESLLDDQAFAVLDIKLKPTLNRSFFGAQQATAGYRTSAVPGGYSNFFSLNQKVNAQFFGEVHNFGDTRIGLEQIKNLGAEALASMLSTPADFNELKKRSGLHDELYGFRNFVQQDNAIGGVSVTVPLSEKTDLYVGSFNNYHFLRQQRDETQLLGPAVFNALDLASTHREYQSKSKVQLRRTTDRFKLRTDLHYVAFDNRLGYRSQGTLDNAFGGRHRFGGAYATQRVEYTLGERSGFSSNTAFAHESYAHHQQLRTASPEVAALLQARPVGDAATLRQRNENVETRWVQDLRYQLQTSVGRHAVGYRFTRNVLTNEKAAASEGEVVGAFSNPRQTLDYQLHSALYAWQMPVGNLFLDANLELSEVRFPQPGTTARTVRFQYDGSAQYQMGGETNLVLKTSNRLGQFPLEKITGGQVLVDFQTIFRPATALRPFYARTYEGVFFTPLSPSLDLLFASVQARYDNLDDQTFAGNLIVREANQLQSSFWVWHSKLNWTGQRLPLQMALVVEGMRNRFEFGTPEGLRRNVADRYFAELKANTRTQKRFDTGYHPKFSYFVFRNDLTPGVNTFRFVHNAVALKSNWWEERLLVQLHYKHVYFLDGLGTFQNADLLIRGKGKRNLSYFLTIANLFNDTRFVIQDIEQALRQVSQHAVFGRFIHAGVEIKLR